MTKSPSKTTRRASRASNSQGIRHQRLADRVRALTGRVATLEERQVQLEEFIKDYLRIRQVANRSDDPSE